MTKPKRKFVVVLRARSAVRFLENEAVALPVNGPLGPVLATFRTRYVKAGFEAPIPRELWAEVVGETTHSLTEAVETYAAIANELVPILATVCNAPCDELEVEVAFDATEGIDEHEFLQIHLDSEGGMPSSGREFPKELGARVFGALEDSPSRDRLRRGCAYYREAIRYLRPGHQVQFAAYLWMAVEALTKVALDAACSDEDVTDNELLVLWGLVRAGEDQDVRAAKNALNGEVRRRLIFHGDAACMASTRKASDGFEHGFLDFAKVRDFALSAIEAGAADHVRRAIFELSGVDGIVVDALREPRYIKPRADWPLARYLRGTFNGPAADLAPPDEQYPHFDWTVRINTFRRKDDGTYEVNFTDEPTLKVGAGVTASPGSLQVWGPEMDPTAMPPGDGAAPGAATDEVGRNE